ncbi:MAG: Radical SAM domain protein [Candidatus Moranbacteria bacterium GW2011_GWF2_34_56]|nr:MAG: Radical SAM domain protein [Candidatus Moranbacteria bacterium GW2011_GWF1_34_10]KKP65356.1 MAG: Radical SAM domain protein [Candidatus Moranbacteria bacterium GW2011_GWF2_34_56]HBI17452.1 hypothetical protein [Candidatus Moranbacteria bacterium]
MKDRITLRWKNDLVSIIWHNHPLVMAGNKILKEVVDAIYAESNLAVLSEEISRKYNLPLDDVVGYITHIHNSINAIQQSIPVERKQENALSMATLNVTRKCNLNCNHCYASGSTSFDEMSLEASVIAIKNLSSIITEHPRLLVLSGGEPTLEKEKLKKIVLTGVENGLKIRVNSNGYFIDDELAGFFGKNSVLVQISLDGIDGETNAILRNETRAFDKAVGAIKTLVSHGCRTRISFTIHDKNINQLRGLLKLAEQLGVEQVVTSSLVGIGNALQGKVKAVKFKEEFEELFSVVEGNKKWQEMTRSTLLAETIVAIRSGIKFQYCGTGHCTCCVNSDGTLYPCINMVRDGFEIGNVVAPSIGETWKSSHILNGLRSLDVDSMNGTCSSCVFRYFCGGYCRGETLESGSKITDPYVRCIEWKQGMLKIMEIIAKSPDVYDFELFSKTGGFHRE